MMAAPTTHATPHGHIPHCSHIKIAGAWVSIKQTHIKIAGAWVPVKKGYEKLQGTWHEFCQLPTTIPVFAGAIGDLEATVGKDFRKDVSHSFRTGGVPASYNLNNAPAGMVISDVGVITWPAPAAVISVSGVSVTATNSAGFAVSDAFGVSAVAGHGHP